MFTGIVTDIGRVEEVEERGASRRVILAAPFDAAALPLGASIACQGVCLTVADRGKDGGAGWFAVDLSSETLARTTAGTWWPGTRINLERALKVGDELGGHFVTGHVDAAVAVLACEEEAGARRCAIVLPEALAPFVAPRGSVTLDGVSLTVNDVEDDRFSVTLIPHTLAVTSWGETQEGDVVNLEVDLLARYLSRLSF